MKRKRGMGFEKVGMHVEEKVAMEVPGPYVGDAGEEEGKKVDLIFLMSANKYTPDFMIEKPALV